MYIGERQIERGDCLPHEEVWKRFKKKIQFKLSKSDKKAIGLAIDQRLKGKCVCTGINELKQYVFTLIEKRDEIFKKKFSKRLRFPSPYPNHL